MLSFSGAPLDVGGWGPAATAGSSSFLFSGEETLRSCPQAQGCCSCIALLLLGVTCFTILPFGSTSGGMAQRGFFRGCAHVFHTVKSISKHPSSSSTHARYFFFYRGYQAVFMHCKFQQQCLVWKGAQTGEECCFLSPLPFKSESFGVRKCIHQPDNDCTAQDKAKVKSMHMQLGRGWGMGQFPRAN